jgi:hypothetical protein
LENRLVRYVFNIYVKYKYTNNIFFLTGGFNNSKELNMLKQGNACLTNNVLFVLPEFEVSYSTLV